MMGTIINLILKNQSKSKNIGDINEVETLFLRKID